MRKLGAYVAIAAFLAFISSPSPSAAFGLGPFGIGIPLPFFGYPHRIARRGDLPASAPIYDSAEPGAASARGRNSALLYPGLGLPAIYDDVFSPAASAQWPFGYDAIFRAAFAKAPADRDQQPCPMTVRGAAIVERIEREIRPTAAQRPLLQKLGRALGMASGLLAKSCPKEITPRPVARLQLMETQIEELTMALDVIRQPLQDFEQSLDRDQHARFDATPTTSGHNNPADNIAPSCSVTPTAIDRSIDELKQSVQPSDAQRDALADVKKAFGRAASNLDANCSTSHAPSAVARLEATEARLDGAWRAVLTIQVALAKFESQLSADQRGRFDAVDFAAR